jgi:hypothetical protein
MSSHAVRRRTRALALVGCGVVWLYALSGGGGAENPAKARMYDPITLSGKIAEVYFPDDVGMVDGAHILALGQTIDVLPTSPLYDGYRVSRVQIAWQGFDWEGPGRSASDRHDWEFLESLDGRNATLSGKLVPANRPGRKHMAVLFEVDLTSRARTVKLQPMDAGRRDTPHPEAAPAPSLPPGEPSSPAAGQWLDYGDDHPVTLAGRLVHGEFPGPDDDIEWAYLLVLDRPINIRKGRPYEEEEKDIDELHIWFRWSGDRNQRRRVRDLLGTRISLRGSLLNRESIHQHTPVLLKADPKTIERLPALPAPG